MNMFYLDSSIRVLVTLGKLMLFKSVLKIRETSASVNNVNNEH